MFTKILIANRGEIACRIIKTAREMGISTVAVFSDADRHASFVEMADEAIHLGASESALSYLDIEKIMAAATKTGAQAIHPGYGFLSENAKFAERCEEAGIRFIGPRVASIVAMGSKSEAKALMESAGVPLVPGYHGAEQSLAVLLKKAGEIGFPVLLKASAGGGGKGMRVVNSAPEFKAAFEGAKREALSSFGDDKLLLEKYLDHPRHIEIQIFFDNQGNGVFLFDRDCSIQRRHQKVIEEAPAPGISAQTRQAMGAAALECARAIDYTGAGTVEFLLDADEKFYFMEMNTRLQVEHPVTEMITGIDLVAWQLRIANNEPLPLQQSQLESKGHAFEARIYAEDPYNNFLPATGKIRYLSTPPASRHIRMDSGVRENDSISVYYDPMIAKLIVWDETRSLAIARMIGALTHFKLSGMPNNIGFVTRIFASEAFATKPLSTGFIEQHQAQLLMPPDCTPDCTPETHLLAAIYYVRSNLLQSTHLAQHQNSVTRARDPLHNPWNSKIAWRLNQENTESFTLIHKNEELTFEIIHPQTGDIGRVSHSFPFQIRQSTDNARVYQVRITLNEGRQPDAEKADAFSRFNADHCVANAPVRADIDGHMFLYHAHRHNDLIDLFHGNHCWEYHIKKPEKKNVESQNENSLCAPMHGKIIALNVKQGEFVEKGQILLVMEAMKMEHSIASPRDGIVVDCRCKAGDLIEEGFELIEISEG
jgi:3-methylcrotonyl-CoA carboxylase alpha subunit